jgi:hypothetical protein
MPRSTKKAQTFESTITEALDTPIERTVEEAADYLGVAPIRLQEIFCDRLQSAEPMVWLTIPTEHEERLEIFKREIDAENSVRRFDAPTEPAAEILQSEELPIIQDEPSKSKCGKGGKLTEKKTEAIDKGRKASTQTQKGVADALTILQAQQGIQDAAQAGSTYLHAFTATLGKVKGQGLTTIAAQMLQDLNNKSGFTPDEILQDLGIELSADIQSELMEVLNPALGKYQQATEEILETSWGNGFNLQEELESLTELLNSSN